MEKEEGEILSLLDLTSRSKPLKRWKVLLFYGLYEKTIRFSGISAVITIL